MLLSLINEYCKVDVPSNLVSGIITLVIGSLFASPILLCEFSIVSSTDIFIFIPVQYNHHFIISKRSTYRGYNPPLFFWKLSHWTHNSESLDAALLSAPIHDTNYLWNYSSSVSLYVYILSST